MVSGKLSGSFRPVLKVVRSYWPGRETDIRAAPGEVSQISWNDMDALTRPDNAERTWMVDLTHLRCFVALAEKLHFGRAAARLNMTQPPLSRQLQQPEHTMSVRLVERSSRFVGPTAAGKSFVVKLRGILRTLDEAVVTARRIDTGEGGVLKGISP